MKFKGTKGYWLMDCTNKSIEKYPNYLPIISERAELICLVNHESCTIPLKEYCENAKLIASAPHLLEALEKIMSISNDSVVIRIASKAINKALD